MGLLNTTITKKLLHPCRTIPLQNKTCIQINKNFAVLCDHFLVKYFKIVICIAEIGKGADLTLSSPLLQILWNFHHSKNIFSWWKLHLHLQVDQISTNQTTLIKQNMVEEGTPNHAASWMFTFSNHGNCRHKVKRIVIKQPTKI